MAKGERDAAYNTINTETNRYRSQQGPMANQMAYNYGYGSQQNMRDYGDIMGRYRDLYGYSTTNPFTASHASAGGPGASYAGFEDFSKTGGYTPQDAADVRSRGASPVRAAYANAEREANRSKAIQGGYSPNFAPTMAKMAREQSQSASDAAQNTEIGLQQAIRQGKLSGLGGMQTAEEGASNRGAQVSMFNAGQDTRANEMNQRLPYEALAGMTSLYGTTPGMASTYGNQVLNAVQQGGQFGLGTEANQINAARLPGQWDTWLGRIGDVTGMAGNVYDAFKGGGSPGGLSTGAGGLGTGSPDAVASGLNSAGIPGIQETPTGIPQFGGGVGPSNSNPFGVSNYWDYMNPYGERGWAQYGVAPLNNQPRTSADPLSPYGQG